MKKSVLAESLMKEHVVIRHLYLKRKICINENEVRYFHNEDNNYFSVDSWWKADVIMFKEYNDLTSQYIH